MSQLQTPLADDARTERKRKRVAVLKFSLAGAALLGVAAAATSAAWTDDAWFKAAASAIDPSTGIELQAGLSNGSTVVYDDADDETAAVVIDASEFADLVPNEERTVVLHVRNDGTVDLDVSNVVDATGALFTGADPATAVVVGTVPTLQPGDEATVDLVVTAPDWDDSDAAYFDAEGTVKVTFTGTTVE